MKKLSKIDRDLIKAFSAIILCCVVIVATIYVFTRPQQEFETLIHHNGVHIAIALIVAALIGIFLIHTDFKK